MNQRKLRIAWSVAWGIPGMLLIALWVRSYWMDDALWVSTSPSFRTTVQSDAGRVIVHSSEVNYRRPYPVFRYQSYPSAAMPAQVQWWCSFAPNNPLVIVPHWSIALVIAAIAGLPWAIRFPSRFSLRSLLIAMTVFAALLGLAIWAAE